MMNLDLQHGVLALLRLTLISGVTIMARVPDGRTPLSLIQVSLGHGKTLVSP